MTVRDGPTNSAQCLLLLELIADSSKRLYDLADASLLPITKNELEQMRKDATTLLHAVSLLEALHLIK